MGLALDYKSKVINDLTKIKFYDNTDGSELTTLGALKTAGTNSRLLIEGWGTFGAGTEAKDVKNVKVFRGSKPKVQEVLIAQSDLSISTPATGANKWAYVRFNIQDFSYSSRIAQNRRDNVLGKTYQIGIDSTSVPQFLGKLVNAMIAEPARFPEGDHDLISPVITSGSTVVFLDQNNASQTVTLSSDWKYNDKISGNVVSRFVSISGATAGTDALKIVAKDYELAINMQVLDSNLLSPSPLVVVASTVEKTGRFAGRGTYEFLDSSVVLNNEVNNLPDFPVMNDERPIRGSLYANYLFSVDMTDNHTGNFANANAIVNRRYNYELWFNEALAGQFGNAKALAVDEDASTEKSILLGAFLALWAGNTYALYNENNQCPGEATGTTVATGTTAWNEATQSGVERVSVSNALLSTDISTWAD